MTRTSRIWRVLRDAAENLSPRQRYARNVIFGRQGWSGADLQGKAKIYGGHYAYQRIAAREALFRAGGHLAYCGRYGSLEAVVPVGMDDWGNALYQTLYGPAVATEKRNLKWVEK